MRRCPASKPLISDPKGEGNPPLPLPAGSGSGGCWRIGGTQFCLGHSESNGKSLKFEFSELLPTVGSCYDFLVALGIVSKCQVMVVAASRTAVPVHRTAVPSHKTIVKDQKVKLPSPTKGRPLRVVGAIRQWRWLLPEEASDAT